MAEEKQVHERMLELVDEWAARPDGGRRFWVDRRVMEWSAEGWRGLTGEDEDADVLSGAMAHAQIDQLHERLRMNAWVALSDCQSPIEKMMLAAIWIAGSSSMHITVGDDEVPAGVSHLSIYPQHSIGRYRVDFLLVHNDCVGAPSNRTRALVVECDGHDFHEKTKAQASRDKKRDRELQAAGYAVFRYSGSDIWADVMTHAEEVLHVVSGRRKRG